MQSFADDLKRYGVVTIPVFSADDRANVEKRMWEAMDEFPEYKIKGKRTQRVLGGFGALGNPSSFHHPLIQHLRNEIKSRVSKPLFRRYNHRGRGLEVLFDRVCVRAGEFGTPTKESWHRDIYDGGKYGLRSLPETDEIFGGWINLSNTSQRFVGIVGSHKGEDARNAQKQAGGFAVLTESQIKQQRVIQRLSEQANKQFGSVTTDGQGQVVVPSGHMIVFFQRVLHSVVSGKQPKDPQLRLFFGHRLTYGSSPLFPLEGVVTNNAVPRIPSGQIPPMYSMNHYAFFSTTARYQKWGESTFKRQCLFERTTPKGQTYFTPGSMGNRNQSANKERYMPSLTEMGFDPYPYGETSRRTLTPEPLDDYGWDGDTDMIDAATDEED
jgi:hypothetical protein